MRIIPIAALCLLALPCVSMSTAHAHGPQKSSWHRPVQANAVRVMIEAPEGGGFTTVQHRGATFVVGELGERYNVRLVNDSADRLEVVVTVDGRDVISGKLGDFKKQRGYVLDPFGEVVIDGFRQSLDHVAAFRFSSVRESYSARRGTPQHAGVIGVAVFRERPQPVHHHHHARRGWSGAEEESRSARPSTKPSASKDRAAGNAKADKLGTEFGETMVSQVIEVPFVRKSSTRPDELHKVVYDSAERLRARGVPIEPVFVSEPWSPDPSPWPAARHDDRFALPPPPRRWR